MALYCGQWVATRRGKRAQVIAYGIDWALIRYLDGGRVAWVRVSGLVPWEEAVQNPERRGQLEWMSSNPL